MGLVLIIAILAQMGVPQFLASGRIALIIRAPFPRAPVSGRHRPGQVAQLVEQRTENPCVAGSIPALATIYPTTSIRLSAAGSWFLPRQ